MLFATSPSSGNPFLMIKSITLLSIWVIFFGFFSFFTYSSNDQSKVLSFTVLKSYQWLVLRATFTSDAVYTDRTQSQVWFCMHSLHASRLHQLFCTLNKDGESNDNDWLKYPIILFDAVLQSLSSFLVFWRPCFCNLEKTQCGMVTCDSLSLTLN